MDNTVIFILSLAAAFILFYIFLFNSLVAIKKQTQASLSGIDVQLKRRYDLIPNLVETVKGYAKHEQQIFTKIAKIRNSAMHVGTDNLKAKSMVENELTETLNNLLMVTENYPRLQANQNFLALQEELSETEDQIAASRRIYNSNVGEYNTKIDQFPSNIIAFIHRFQKFQFFQIEVPEKQNINVSMP